MHYIGPVDGHDVEALIKALEEIRDRADAGPILLHVLTNKGHGYEPAERDPRTRVMPSTNSM